MKSVGPAAHVFDVLRNVSMTHSQEIVIGLISTAVCIIGSSEMKKKKKSVLRATPSNKKLLKSMGK